MAQRRPIASHPAFAPLIALWFAALLGLAVAVLPAPLLERAFSAAGLNALAPLTPAGRAIASGAAALLGAALGLALALLLARRGRDPRPTYEEAELPADHPVADEPIRRPLRVREELGEGVPGEVAASDSDSGDASRAPTVSEPRTLEAEEGFMILTPQPVHPPRPAPDLQGLLEQFDNALAAFRSGDDSGPAPARQPGPPDPVHAFVARQTGTPAPGQTLSPLGGLMPDHQAELRAALDKLARAHRKD